MDWRLKALAFRVLELPGEKHAHYFLVRLADAGIDLVPEISDQPAPAPRRPATAQAN